MTKKKGKKKQIIFTLREVESHMPCGSGYLDALEVLKSLPVAKGAFDYLKGDLPFKRSKYKPDDPIILAEVADILANSALDWALSVFVDTELYSAIYARADEIENLALVQAVKELA